MPVGSKYDFWSCRRWNILCGRHVVVCQSCRAMEFMEKNSCFGVFLGLHRRWKCAHKIWTTLIYLKHIGSILNRKRDTGYKPTTIGTYWDTVHPIEFGRQRLNVSSYSLVKIESQSQEIAGNASGFQPARFLKSGVTIPKKIILAG